MLLQLGAVGISAKGIFGGVSIPQAVSAVATEHIISFICFKPTVSIPQAVSAVATADSKKPVFMRFQKLILESLKP